MRYQYCFALLWFAVLLPTHAYCDSLAPTQTGVSHTQAMPTDTNRRRLAETVCAACHGPQGISISDDYPNLAGQTPMYLVSSLRAYRNGARQAPLMNGVAAKLSDQDIAGLAAFYADLKPAE